MKKKRQISMEKWNKKERKNSKNLNNQKPYQS